MNLALNLAVFNIYFIVNRMKYSFRIMHINNNSSIKMEYEFGRHCIRFTFSDEINVKNKK